MIHLIQDLIDADAYVNERLYDESKTDSDKGSDDFGQEDEEKVTESYLPFTTDPEGPEFYPKIDLDAVFRSGNIKYSKNVTNTFKMKEKCVNLKCWVQYQIVDNKHYLKQWDKLVTEHHILQDIYRNV